MIYWLRKEVNTKGLEQRVAQKEVSNVGFLDYSWNKAAKRERKNIDLRRMTSVSIIEKGRKYARIPIQTCWHFCASSSFNSNRGHPASENSKTSDPSRKPRSRGDCEYYNSTLFYCFLVLTTVHWKSHSQTLHGSPSVSCDSGGGLSEKSNCRDTSHKARDE